ncbi:hypothetical protein EJ02DRAFT_462015 [Clathrospora elynae]|uniref:BTB domain-containing protein n=1 Tax=Clathrospora elynae TaxID=706981 RepID=A0A6A5T397_9PLEO|nr:hypothetical protein EJ02DRAFT_462015 [Clathrospora elynae]
MAGASEPLPVAPQKRTRPPLLSRDHTLVTINIGGTDNEEKKAFMLHSGLICSQSPYFSKAFQGHFRESEERAIYLPHVTASTLRLYQFWLYGQSTRVEPQKSTKYKPVQRRRPDGDNRPVNGDEGSDSSEDEIISPAKARLAPAWIDREEFLFNDLHMYNQTLLRLYALADVYDTPQLREDLMTVLVELTLFNQDNKGKTNSWKNQLLLEELCGALPSTSHIYQFAVKRMALYGTFDTMKRSALELLPGPFLLDIIQVALPLTSKHQPKLMQDLGDSCNFHEHKHKGEVKVCKKRQRRDEAFYASFLRACMSEVYDIEDAEVEAKTKTTKTKAEAAEVEENTKVVEAEAKAKATEANTKAKAEAEIVQRAMEAIQSPSEIVDLWNDLEAHQGG